MKKSYLFLVFVSLALCACENPWMAEVLEEKIVTFNSNGGSPVPDQVLFKGERVKRPTDPTKYGFRFAGWYTDNVTFMFPYNFDFVPLEDMTLHAKWIENIFQSVDDLREFLNTPLLTTVADPCVVKLNINNSDMLALKQLLFDLVIEGKYVFLDLSGSVITTIPSNAFRVIDASNNSSYPCNSLVGIIIPDSVQSIEGGHEMGAFQGCENLTSVTIGSGVISIGDYAFHACNSLTNVTIPDSVNSIGRAAFDCINLTSVTFKGNIPSNGFANDSYFPVFLGDLRDKYYTGNPPVGTPGTYIATQMVSGDITWTKQP